MNEITYTAIEPLLADSRIEGNIIFCTFQAPGSDRAVEAKSVIRKSRSVKNQVIDVAKRNVMMEVRRAAYRMVGSLLGRGMVGRTARSVVASTLSQQHQQLSNTFSREDKENAIVEAFKTVAPQFVRDEATNTWRTPKELSEFDKRMLEQPVKNSFDLRMLKRMVVHLAGVNGDISLEEKVFLEEHLGLSHLEIDELYIEEPVLAVECEEISPEAKETLFLMVYAVALADNHLDEKEKEQLDRYAAMLDLSAATVEQLALIARQHLLEGALAMGSSRERILDLGQQLGMDEKEALRTYIRYQKRGN